VPVAGRLNNRDDVLYKYLQLTYVRLLCLTEFKVRTKLVPEDGHKQNTKSSFTL
jgi:hypothetical protein